MVVSANRFLSKAEMKENAEYILAYLMKRGWTKNAVCGMLGNMQTESSINPGIWQDLASGRTDLGFGLVQWTPMTKLRNWASANGKNYKSMATQLDRIIWEVANGEQYYPTSKYPLTFKQFTKSKKTSDYLAMTFLANYERPRDSNQPARGTQAKYWYKVLKGTGAGGSTETNFMFPTVQRVTSGFRPADRPDHFGVDFAEAGTHIIHASASGTVSRSYKSDTYGECVFILHDIDGKEYETVYAHMREGSRMVSEGQAVKQGDDLGIMGNTGDSDGQHLHFELHIGRWNVNKTNAVDPLPYLGKESIVDDPETPVPNDPKKKSGELIHLLLSDTVSGWK